MDMEGWDVVFERGTRCGTFYHLDAHSLLVYPCNRSLLLEEPHNSKAFSVKLKKGRATSRSPYAQTCLHSFQ